MRIQSRIKMLLIAFRTDENKDVGFSLVDYKFSSYVIITLHVTAIFLCEGMVLSETVRGLTEKIDEELLLIFDHCPGVFLRALFIPTMYRIALAPKRPEGIFGMADTQDKDQSGGIELP